MRDIPAWPTGAAHGPDELAMNDWVEDAGPYLRLTPHRIVGVNDEEPQEQAPPRAEPADRKTGE